MAGLVPAMLRFAALFRVRRILSRHDGAERTACSCRIHVAFDLFRCINGSRRRSLHRGGSVVRVIARDLHMLKKLMASALAVMLAFGAVTATGTSPAEAGRGGRIAAGVAAGIIGLGVLGAMAHARDRHYRDYDEVCYRGPRECGWVGRRCFINRYGEEVCRGGRWNCWRDTVCE
jgi:hypothetical protein